MALIDTPGMMWPKIEHDSDGYMLAANHAIGRNAVIDEEVAVELGAILLMRYAPQLASAMVSPPRQWTAPALVEAIAARRGCRIKGGGLDLEKAALILLNDYRSGAIGRISLETPETRRQMLDEHVRSVSAAKDSPPQHSG